MRDFLESVAVLALALFLWAAVLAHDLRTGVRIPLAAASGALAAGAYLARRMTSP